VTGPSVVDPGLASERTQLAWARTALVVAANGALLCRFAHRVDPPTLGYAAGGALLVLAGVLWLHAGAAYANTNAALRAGRSPVRPREIRAVWVAATAATMAVGLVAVTAFL